MKKVIVAISIFLFLFGGISIAYDRGHVWIDGKVDSIFLNTITLSGINYTIDPKCKVIIVYKEKRAFHEKAARLSDVHSGASVFAKKIGTVLYEIRIKGW